MLYIFVNSLNCFRFFGFLPQNLVNMWVQGTNSSMAMFCFETLVSEAYIENNFCMFSNNNETRLKHEQI